MATTLELDVDLPTPTELREVKLVMPALEVFDEETTLMSSEKVVRASQVNIFTQLLTYGIKTVDNQGPIYVWQVVYYADQLLKVTSSVIDASDENKAEHSISVSVITAMHDDLIAREFDKLHTKPTLSIATMVDPRLKKCGFSHAQQRVDAEELLREQVRTLSFSGSAVARPTSAAEQGTAKRSILDDLHARIAAAEMESSSFESGEDEVTNYLREPHQPTKSDPLAW